jgi:hypothetical protein
MGEKQVEGGLLIAENGLGKYYRNQVFSMGLMQ